MLGLKQRNVNIHEIVKDRKKNYGFKSYYMY